MHCVIEDDMGIRYGGMTNNHTALRWNMQALILSDAFSFEFDPLANRKIVDSEEPHADDRGEFS